MQIQKSQQQNQYNYVSSSDFNSYLTTLQTNQRNQLFLLIENHPKIEIINKQIKKYYKSKDNILKQLQYLIQQQKKRYSMAQESLTSHQSFMTQQINKNVHLVVSFNINLNNYLRIIKDILTIKIVNVNVYELQLIQQQSSNILSQLQSKEYSALNYDNSKLIVTNLCQNGSKIFMVFKEYYQLIQLQALIDVNRGLQSIEQIISIFQQKKIHFFQTPYPNMDFYFFKVTSTQIWQKLITNINNRLKNSCVIVIKNSYLSQLKQYSSKLNERVKVVINQNQFSFQNYQINQMKLLPPQQSITNIKQHVISILTKNHISFSYQDYPIDVINNYNIIKIQQNKQDEIILIKPNLDNKKQFVYFLYYNVLMEIVKGQGGVQLVERKMVEEINSKLYKNSLEQTKKHCVKSKISFFYLPQSAQFCKTINLASLKKIKDNDRNRLLYYKYKLSQENYKIQLSPELGQKESCYIIQNYKKAFLMKFQSELFLKKIGSIKSQEIVRRFRSNGLGCVEGKVGICRTLIQKYLEEDNKLAA